MASALIQCTCLRITDPLCSLVKKEQILHVLNHRNTKRFVVSFHDISWVFFRDKSWGILFGLRDDSDLSLSSRDNSE